MNPFYLLFLSIKEVLHIVAKENDKIRVFFVYIPKMNLDNDNHKLSKAKNDFLEVQGSLHINPKLSIQIPPPNAMWDLESTTSSKCMSIIGENPHKYAILDPNDLDNIVPPFKSFDDIDIPKLDRIPPYARSIQQVLVDPHKLNFILLIMHPL